MRSYSHSLARADMQRDSRAARAPRSLSLIEACSTASGKVAVRRASRAFSLCTVVTVVVVDGFRSHTTSGIIGSNGNKKNLCVAVKFN